MKKTLFLQNVTDSLIIRQFLGQFKEVKEFNVTKEASPETNYEYKVESYTVMFEDGFDVELTFSPKACLIIDENLFIIEIENNYFKEVTRINRD